MSPTLHTLPLVERVIHEPELLVAAHDSLLKYAMALGVYRPVHATAPSVSHSWLLCAVIAGIPTETARQGADVIQLAGDHRWPDTTRVGHGYLAEMLEEAVRDADAAYLRWVELQIRQEGVPALDWPIAA